MTHFVAIVLMVAVGAATAHAADRHSLVVRGSVVDAAGDPMVGARVFLEGPHAAATTVDANGAYLLRVPVADWTALERAPLAVWVDAGRTGWTFNLANGSPALRLELRARRDSTGARRCVIRSNDSEVTAGLATGIARRGALRDTIELRFVGTAGPDAGFRDLSMFSMEEVAVPPAPAVVAKPKAPSKPPVATGDSTEIASAPGTPGPADSLVAVAVVVVRPGDTVSVRQPPSPPPTETCECRVEGTVEVRSRDPLSERTPIVFWLESNPAERDSVELFMGSPRPFQLIARGCGSHRVRYEVRGRQRLNLASPDPVIDCLGQRTRQVRIVLAPSGR